MQNQPQRKGGGDDGLMIIGALLIMITVMWFGFRDYVIYGACRLLYWIYGVLPDAITPGNATERRDMLLSAARYNHRGFAVGLYQRDERHGQRALSPVHFNHRVVRLGYLAQSLLPSDP